MVSVSFGSLSKANVASYLGVKEASSKLTKKFEKKGKFVKLNKFK